MNIKLDGSFELLFYHDISSYPSGNLERILQEFVRKSGRKNSLTARFWAEIANFPPFFGHHKKSTKILAEK